MSEINISPYPNLSAFVLPTGPNNAESLPWLSCKWARVFISYPCRDGKELIRVSEAGMRIRKTQSRASRRNKSSQDLPTPSGGFYCANRWETTSVTESWLNIPQHRDQPRDHLRR